MGGKTARSKERGESPATGAEKPQIEAEGKEEELVLFPPPDGETKPARAKREEVPKIAFAENVYMTQAEYDKLVIDFGKVAADWMVAKLDNTKGSNGNRYKSDYRAIRNWVVDAYEDAKRKGYVKQQYNRDTGSGSATAAGFGTGSTLSDD